MNICHQLIKFSTAHLHSTPIFVLFMLIACTTASANSITRKTLTEINIQLGMNAIEQDDMQNAKKKLYRAVIDAPKLPEAWFSLAYFMEKKGNLDLANVYYLKAIRLAPHRGDVHYNYANFLCRIDHYELALKYFDQAAKYSGNLYAASAYSNAGQCALKIPNKKLAKRYFALASREDPTQSG